MQVAILGAGAIAYGNAALLCRDGHDVTLWSPSGRRTATLAAGAPLGATGAVEGRFHPRIAASCADALSGAEAVVVAVPGYGHRHVLDAAAPFLRSEQVVVFSSHMSLAALYLAGLLRKRGMTAPIESRQLTTNDNVWIQRIGIHVTVLLGGNGFPVAERDLAFIAAAFDSDRTAFLLSAVKPVRKSVVGANMIQLRGRLVIPRAPTLTAVHSDDRTLIRTKQNDVGVVRIDPNVLIIVAARRAAPAVPGFAAVRRFPTNHARRVHDLRILRIKPHDRQIATADSKSRPRIVGCAAPRFAV